MVIIISINYLKSIKNTVISTNNLISTDTLRCVRNEILKVKKEINFKQEYLLQLGRLIELNDMKSKGKSLKQIKKYYQIDNEYIKNVKKDFNTHIRKDSKYMMGYPSNICKDSYAVNYFRWLESQMSFTNSCGNPYKTGNYRMNNSKYELNIIEKIKENLGLISKDYWGYITTGGTEGNLWGIREGISKYKNGVLYYSDSAHYSVRKACNFLSNTEKIEVNSKNGSIDCEKLLSAIKNNYNKFLKPAIILLTYGTTLNGAIDDVKYIKDTLKKLNIPHYIHLDAALYGGIPKSQKISPIANLINLNDLDIDSISISLHKYIGSPNSNGVLLAKSQFNKSFVDYIGQDDITISGSRNFPPFSTLQRIKEIFERSNDNDYSNSIEYFAKLLKKHNIDFFKGTELGNIFVIKKPSEKICKKYQLSTFKLDNVYYSHIVIFPRQSRKILGEMILEIKKENANF